MPTYVPNDDNPAEGAVAVTPHDTTELATVCRALYVGGAGNVSVSMGGSGALHADDSNQHRRHVLT